MANKRIFYAVHQAGFTTLGANTFTSAHGVQSIGINTTFNLEQVFEVGQISIYENIENIPDIEVTMEKVLDGYPLLYHLATNGAGSPTLVGRSNVRSTVGMSIYSDEQESASGTPISQVTMSGLYVSAVNYTLNVQGNSTESLTLVGNDKTWLNAFTPTDFDNTDEPKAITGSGGVQRREDVLFGATDTTAVSASLVPLDIPGITASGTNEQDINGDFGAHLQSIRISSNLGREELFELGRRGPYHRYVNFPIEVRTEIEVLDIAGDQVEAREEEENLTDQRIYIMMREGSIFDVGNNNKLASVTWGGANAGQNGGNATSTYTYTNFNDLTITHPEDPSGL